MSVFSQYIVSIIAVCICCGIFRRLVGDKGSSAPVIHVLCAIILTITVISPVLSLNNKNWRGYIDGIQADTDELIQSAAANSNEELRSIITEKVGAYILEKATSYDCSISRVEVVLSTDQIPTPKSLQIVGRFSPYGRNKLSEIIESNLGIPKENQQWNYQN